MQSEEILRPLDDIRVRGGACNWYEVANAIVEVRRRLEAALSAAEPSRPRMALDADDVINELANMPCETQGAEDLEAGCCRTCRARSIRSALTAQVQDVAVPDGWQLVPKEPTKRMLKELCLIDGFSDRALKQRYRDMLAAAPAKQEGKP